MSTVTLISSDNQSFVVDRAVADHAEAVRMFLEDCPDGGNIPLPNVDAKCLKHIVDLSGLYDAGDDKGSKAKIRDRVETFDKDLLFEVLTAAHFMNIPIIVETMCAVIADMIKGKSPEEIRKVFNIESDWEPEEYERVRKEFAWAFED